MDCLTWKCRLCGCVNELPEDTNFYGVNRFAEKCRGCGKLADLQLFYRLELVHTKGAPLDMKIIMENRNLAKAIDKHIPDMNYLQILHYLKEFRDEETVQAERFTVHKWSEEIDQWVQNFIEGVV